VNFSALVYQEQYVLSQGHGFPFNREHAHFNVQDANSTILHAITLPSLQSAANSMQNTQYCPSTGHFGMIVHETQNFRASHRDERINNAVDPQPNYLLVNNNSFQPNFPQLIPQYPPPPSFLPSSVAMLLAAHSAALTGPTRPPPPPPNALGLLLDLAAAAPPMPLPISRPACALPSP
jgi:hypothetical protein